jgi:hypothetical protein
MCYILRDGENLGKFDAKSDVSIFFGYFTTSQASWVYNLRTKTVMESVNVVIDDETTTDHLEEEEPHIEGSKLAFMIGLMDPLVQMFLQLVQHYLQLQKMKTCLGHQFLTWYPTCHHPELNKVVN